MPITLDDLDHLHTIAQAAKKLHVSARTLMRMISRREIDVVRIGAGRGHPYITERAMLDYLNRRVVKALDNEQARPRRRVG